MTKNELKFLEFHKANPHVYKRLVEMALELAVKGHQRYGIAGLFEVLRWETAISTTESTFKLCNNHRAYYARLIMENVPRLRRFFVIRDNKGHVDVGDDDLFEALPDDD